MTIVIYKFNLEDPEDRDHLKAVQQAQAMHSVLFEFVRNSKHISKNLDDKTGEGFDLAKTRVIELMEEEGVVIE